jgi:hypothetical protein
MALMLAISGPRDVQGFESPKLLDVGMTALAVVDALLASVAITVVTYGYTGRRKGSLFLNEPGHWLLVEIAARQALFIAISLFERAAATIQGRAYGTESVIGVALLVWFLPGTVVLALNIYIGRTKCIEQHWSRVFYAKGTAALLPLIGDFLVQVSHISEHSFFM